MDRKTGSGELAGSSGTLYDHWSADLASTADYYPGGMMMPGRNTEHDWSRMGSQSQQKDDEVYGKGNTYAYKYRMNDARINRFFSADPLHTKYPYNSDYAFAENDLIRANELEGLEKYYSQDGTLQWTFGDNLKVKLVNDDFVKTNAGNKVALKQLDANSTDVGMNQPELHARAFLTMIRTGEGTLGEKGYKTQFAGNQFSDYSDHPDKIIKSGKYSSSAAGAYQVLSRTWKGKAGLNARTSLGIKDFSPKSQDKFGLWLINNRSALKDVVNGNVENAIKKTNNEWASLPESPYGQPTQTMQGAKNEFSSAISNELQGKSDIATPKGELEPTIDKLTK